eukprot:6788048-Lingulodinium_polyedra.AAC.1
MLERLANMLGVCRHALVAEFARCYPAPLSVFRKRRCSRREAWATGFRSLTANRTQKMCALGR